MTTQFDEQRYRDYLAAFNKADYELLHRDFFTEDVTLVTLGNVLSGQQAIRDFYGFFHQYVREQITLIGFYPTEGGFFAHVAMRLEAFADLTQQVLESHGIFGMPAIPSGLVFENEMFIHYEVENGKLKVLRCAEYIPPRNQ